MSQDLTLEQVVGVWRAVLRDPGATAHTSFLQDDGGSMTAVRLRAALRDELGLEVEFDDLLENDTPEFFWEFARDA